MSDRQHDYAAACSAQLLNLGHVQKGKEATITYQKIFSVVLDAIRMSEAEARQQWATPSEN